MNNMSYTQRIKEVGQSIIDKLIEKNTAYGDSVFKPVELFGESIPASVAIKARISDKLSRIKNKGISDETEDTLDDVIGYLILLKIVLEDEAYDARNEKIRGSLSDEIEVNSISIGGTYYQTNSL